MSKLQDSHEAEVSEKGWSGWDMLAMGAGYSVFPRLGEALLADAKTSEDRRIARILIDFKDESEAETTQEEVEFWERREDETLAVFLWMAANPLRVFSVTDSSGRRVLSYIGDGLIYFGENTKSFPANYSGGAEKWSEDCIWAGLMLSSENLASSAPVFDFLSKWLWNIWS